MLSPSAIPLPVCLFDRDGRVVEANQRFADLVDVSPAGALTGSSLSSLGVLPRGIVDGIISALERGDAVPVEAVVGHGRADGMQVFLALTPSCSGASTGLVLTILPADRAGQVAHERRTSFAIESVGQWIWEYDLIAGTVWRSPGWQQALGYAPDELGEDAEPWNIVHPEDRRAAEDALGRVVSGHAEMFEAIYRLRHRDGSWRWFMSRGRIVGHAADGRPSQLLATTIDVHRQKEAEVQLTRAIDESAMISRRLAAINSQLAALSENDGLTGLANRRVFEREWRRRVDSAQEGGHPLALVMVDVDHFKLFNDGMGHLAGDDCLRRVAGVLAEAASPEELVCRYGGEEFAILLGGDGLTDAEAYARRVMAGIARLDESHPLSPLGRVSVSIGFAILDPGESAEPFLKRADDALYAAKHAGRNCIMIAPSASGRLGDA